MKKGAKRVCVLGLLLAGSLLSTGCPESNVLAPSVGLMTIRIEAINIDPNGRFVNDPVGVPDPLNLIFPDFAQVQIETIVIEPINVDDQNGAGSLPINLLVLPQSSDFIAGQPVETTLNLSTGTYRLLNIKLGELFIEDNSDGLGGTLVDPANWDDPMNPTCSDFIRTYFASLTPNLNLILVDFASEVLFNVTAEGGSLTIRIDVEAFLDALESNTLCNSCTCEENYNPAVPSTLNCECGGFSGPRYNLNQSSFRAESANFFSFE